MVSDGIEIMHITVIEHTISQIYRVYKDMNVKMIGIFMDGEDNLILCVCKDFTYLFSNLICLKRRNIVFIIWIKRQDKMSERNIIAFMVWVRC